LTEHRNCATQGVSTARRLYAACYRAFTLWKTRNDYSPDGSLLVGPADSHTLSVWDAESGEVVRSIDTKEPGVRDAAFSPDGRRLASAEFDAKVKVWDAETGQELLTLGGHKTWVWKIHFSPDGQRIVSCSRDRTLRIWDGRPLRRRETGSICRKK
jgi:WD40 repeat protein